MHSIRRKLLITLIGALLAAGFTTAAATFFSAQTEFNKFLDTHLKETAESLAQSVTHSFPLADPDHLTIIGDAQSYHIVVQVYDSANNTVWQREDQPYLPLPDAPGFARAKLNGVNWRTYSTPAGPLIITVGQDTAVRTELAASSAFRVLQPCLLYTSPSPRLSNPSRRRGFRLSSQASSAPSTNCWTDCAKASPHSSASPPTPLTNSARR